MPRIIVTTQAQKQELGQPVLLDEYVGSVHLSSDHAAHQLVERLTWAVKDAESSEAMSGSGHRAC